MFKSDLKEVAEARKAINFLQLEIAVVIALDISKKVEAAFEAIAAQQAVEADADMRRPECPECGGIVGSYSSNCQSGLHTRTA